MSNTRKPKAPWLRLGTPGTRRTLQKLRINNRRRTQNYRRLENFEAKFGEQK